MPGSLIHSSASPVFPLIPDLLSLSLSPLSHPLSLSHLAALRDGDVQIGDVLAAAARLGGLHLADNVHAAVADDAPEDDVLVVQEGGGHGGDEELAAVAVGAGVLFVLEVSCVGWLARPEGKGSEGVKKKMPPSMVLTEATYRHGQQPFRIVLQREVLVREALGAIDAHGTRAVAMQKIAALAHELGYL